jgi:hypothetical protein
MHYFLAIFKYFLISFWKLVFKKKPFWNFWIFLKIQISIKLLRYYGTILIINLCYNNTCFFFLTIIYIQKNWNLLKLQYIQINYKNLFWKEYYLIVIIKWHDIKFFSIFNKLILQQCYFIHTKYLYTSNNNISSWKI